MSNVSVDTCYTAASSEVTGRVIARDAISIAYFTAAAALIGLAAGQESRRELALVVPYLNVLMCAKIAHHDLVISCLNRHLRDMTTDGCPHFYRDRLTSTVWIGAVLQTLPILCAVGGLDAVAIAISRTSILTDRWVKLAALWSPYALGAAALLLIVGRVFQFLTARSPFKSLDTSAQLTTSIGRKPRKRGSAA
jgi:hypothetical protein